MKKVNKRLRKEKEQSRMDTGNIGHNQQMFGKTSKLSYYFYIVKYYVRYNSPGCLPRQQMFGKTSKLFITFI